MATLCGGFGIITFGGARVHGGSLPAGARVEPRLHVLPARPGAVLVDITRALPLPVPPRAGLPRPSLSPFRGPCARRLAQGGGGPGG